MEIAGMEVLLLLNVSEPLSEMPEAVRLVDRGTCIVAAPAAAGPRYLLEGTRRPVALATTLVAPTVTAMLRRGRTAAG